MHRIALRQVSKAAHFAAPSALPALSSVNFSSALVAKRHFSKKEKTPSLPEVLLNEIEYENNNEEVDHELVDISDKIKKDFKITTEVGSGVVILTRELKGEKISIRFDCQDTNDDVDFDEEEAEEGDEEADHEEGDEEGSEMENNFGIDFEVTATKGANKLVSVCTATDTGVVYRNLRHLPVTVDNSDMSLYGGPALDDLDESLQKGLKSYLSKRGVNDDLAYFIVAFSREKEQKEYVNWLKNLHDFVSTH